LLPNFPLFLSFAHLLSSYWASVSIVDGDSSDGSNKLSNRPFATAILFGSLREYVLSSAIRTSPTILAILTMVVTMPQLSSGRTKPYSFFPTMKVVVVVIIVVAVVVVVVL